MWLWDVICSVAFGGHQGLQPALHCVCWSDSVIVCVCQEDCKNVTFQTLLQADIMFFRCSPTALLRESHIGESERNLVIASDAYCWVLLLFWLKQTRKLYSPGSPRTSSVAEDDLEFLILLSSVRIIGICHHTHIPSNPGSRACWASPLPTEWHPKPMCRANSWELWNSPSFPKDAEPLSLLYIPACYSGVTYRAMIFKYFLRSQYTNF